MLKLEMENKVYPMGTQNNTKWEKINKSNQSTNFNLKTLNKSPKCKGKWTRINTKYENEKSIIDYALWTKELYANLNTVTIGEEENYKLNGRSKTDHNLILMKIDKSPGPVKKKVGPDLEKQCKIML